MQPSESVQDYLKGIYQIQEEQGGEPVSTSGLAAYLGVQSASVTAMIKRMAAADPQLVIYEPYGGVKLTPEGRRIALEVIRHHRLIESFLSVILGYPWDEVHAEAERLEHVISEAMEDRIALALGDPRTDPHGDPIPDRDGNLPPVDAIPLTDLPAGQTATIQRITAQEPELLRHLAEQGLTLSTQIQVISRAPLNGPLRVTFLGQPGVALALSRDVADKILVQPLRDLIKENPHE